MCFSYAFVDTVKKHTIYFYFSTSASFQSHWYSMESRTLVSPSISATSSQNIIFLSQNLWQKQTVELDKLLPQVSVYDNVAWTYKADGSSAAWPAVQFKLMSSVGEWLGVGLWRTKPSELLIMININWNLSLRVKSTTAARCERIQRYEGRRLHTLTEII